MAAATTAAERTPFLSTLPVTPGVRRLALGAVLVSIAFFALAAPFAQTKLAQVWAFIPVYQSALILNDTITAILLLGQYAILRSRALLVLAAAYLFAAFMAMFHGLSFPGLFAPGGVFNSGPQSTAWLYMFWHAGFPLAVIAYALLKGRNNEGLAPRAKDGSSAGLAIVGAVVAAGVAAAAFTLLATRGISLLPAIMAGNHYTPAMIFVVSSTWAFSLFALVVLWFRRPHTVLDVWLMVALFAWMCDIALAAVLNAGRFDLGFYAGRLYGLAAASFVLGVMLLENGALYARLVRSYGAAGIAKDRETEAHRQVNEAFQAVIDEVPAGIVGLDPERRVIIWNRAAERIFGHAADEVMGRAHALVPPDGVAEAEEIFRRAAGGERIRDESVRRVRKDGTPVEVVFSGAALHHADGSLRGVLFVMNDVTERNRVEQELRQAQKMEAVGQLTGGIAHDFNNLLAVIVGNLDLLVDGAKDMPEQRTFAEEALEAALRGAELTRRLLAFSRRQTLVPKVVRINTFVASMSGMLKRTLGEYIETKTVLADDLWAARVDPSQVEAALVNLAVNARDAMPGGGKLTIETANKTLDEDYVALNPGAVAGDYVMLAVSDSGAGMTKEVLARVFEPFFTTKEVGKGTGLGLSMVYGFIKQSGGHIAIYSEIGIGTTVRLYLPRAMEAAEERAAGPAAEGFKGKGELILAVDDNPQVLRAAVTQLEGLGYRVYQAASGPEALAMMAKIGRIDLLFTDVVMPGGLSGIQLAAEARKAQPGLKVLFTSGFAENAQHGGEVGADEAFLGKPYRRAELAEKVQGVLRGG